MMSQSVSQPSHLLLVLLTTVLLTCQPDTDRATATFKSERVATVALPFPLDAQRQTLTLKTHRAGKNTYLFWQDGDNNRILMYDLSAPAAPHLIQMVSEGPKQVPPAAGGFSVFGLDSIYLSTYVPGRLFRIDTTGQLQQVVVSADTAAQQADMNDLATLNSTMHSDLFRDEEGRIFVPLRFPYFQERPTDEFIRAFPLFSIIDPVKGQNRYSPIRLPVAIFNKKGEPLGRNMSFTGGAGGSVIFSFENDNRVFSTIDLTDYSAVAAASRYEIPPRPLNIDNHPYERAVKSFEYGAIYFDPYRDRYYRFVKLPIEEVDLAFDYERESQNSSRFTIMLLNNKLEVLGELPFIESGYALLPAFVHEKGLALLRSPYHAEYHEDYLTFDIFRFE